MGNWDSEKFLRLSHFTIERALAGIYWVDSKARIHRANATACKMLGYTQDEMITMTVQDLDPQSNAESWAEHWRELKKGMQLSFETVNRTKDGRLIPVEVFSNYIDFEGEEYSCCFVRDISERKLAEENLKKVTLEKERFETELKFGSLVQSEFLPVEAPQYPGFSFAAKMFPARFVGGDFYDFIPLEENRLGILLGDVSGKGVSAALYMARLMSDFRYASRVNPDPGEVMKRVNQVLCERSRRGMFATAVYLLLDLKSKKIISSNAGHLPTFIRRKNKDAIEQVASGGVPLGILGDQNYPNEEIELKSGDRMLLYSDGAIDPKNSAGELFGLERLEECCRKNESEPEELISYLKQRIGEFTEEAPLRDDLTFLAVHVR
ncbi:MAG: SpoIIE family protein phosphatase [Nitrospinae bacterium]|nr:SpoIIE family protein phosphatase [Nitrospinota bacterium]